MPIHIDSMGRFLAGRLDRHSDGGALRDGNDRLWDNFSATRVRFYFPLTLAPLLRPCRGFHLCVVAQPMLLLALAPMGDTLVVMAPVDAIDVTVIAVAAQVEHPSTRVEDALDLPEIVHSHARPPGTRPPRATRATTLVSNASTRGDPGLGG
jgi:hypothetical protein